jgi:DNA-binding response OmpR family regulator
MHACLFDAKFPGFSVTVELPNGPAQNLLNGAARVLLRHSKKWIVEGGKAMTLKVLIADADAELAGAVCSHLIARECDARIARSGLQCLEEVRRFSPQVLVLAVELLWGGGLGVLACLRERRFGCPPAVILTATAANEHRLTRSAPVVDCLLKPFPLASLIESIEAAVKSSVYTNRSVNGTGQLEVNHQESLR